MAGIHSAMPAAIARRRLPDAVFIPPDFEAYRAMSRRVMAVLRENADTVEVVGLDEAYLDLSALSYPKATMRRIATEIRERTGLTCSIGLAENKLLGKIASELAKPAGLVGLTREEALERFASSTPGLIPGIGPKTLERLEGLGVRTLADLRQRDRASLQASFGERSGAWLHRRARFDDESPVSMARETKSQSTETTFDTDISDPAALETSLGRLSEQLCRRLQGRGLAGRNVGIKVRLDDWTNISRARTLEEATNDPAVVVRIATELLREYSPPRPVRLLGVRVAAFEDGTRHADADDQLRLGV
jgi:DNA polymerase-4